MERAIANLKVEQGRLRPKGNYDQQNEGKLDTGFGVEYIKTVGH